MITVQLVGIIMVVNKDGLKNIWLYFHDSPKKFKNPCANVNYFAGV